MDLALGDAIASPPEYAHHFVEKLLIIPPSFHANSHRAQYAHITDGDALLGCARGTDRQFLELQVPHAFYKLDPGLLSLWVDLASSSAPPHRVKASPGNLLTALVFERLAPTVTLPCGVGALAVGSQ